MDNIGPVSLIGINRPERRNAVDPPTADILYRAFRDFEGDDSRRVAVLYGKGKQEDDYINYLEREREGERDMKSEKHNGDKEGK